MSTVTLDSLREAAEAKYGSTDIEVGDTTVRLLNPLRLKKVARDQPVAIQRDLDADSADVADVDQEAMLAEAIRVVAVTPAQAQTLLDAIGGDLAILAEVFETYSRGTQVGEVSASRG